MGSDRIRAEGKKSSSLIPGSKPKKFSFLQPRYQDSVEENKQQANPKPPLFSHSFGQMSVLPIQTKLTIGQPNDKYEQEADRVASQVVQQISTPSSAQSTQRQSVQRMEEPEEEELQAKPIISPLQRMPEEEEELQAKPQISAIQRSLIFPALQREDLQAKSILQRREAVTGEEVSTDLDSAINSSRGGGQPLDTSLQESMGRAMGANFSGVRIHADSQSDRLNQSIQARAFTTGQDLFFRQGQYQPGNRGGQELLAHELTHVVQQNGGAVQRKSEIQGNLREVNITQVTDAGTIQRKHFLSDSKMSYSEDFIKKHLADGEKEAINKSAQRAIDDRTNDSTVIIVNSKTKQKMLKDFADDYNNENHDEHNNIVYTSDQDIVHTTFTNQFLWEDLDLEEYETRSWKGVKIGVGVGLNSKTFGEIGHLDSVEDGSQTGREYISTLDVNSDEYVFLKQLQYYKDRRLNDMNNEELLQLEKEIEQQYRNTPNKYWETQYHKVASHRNLNYESQ